MPRERGRETYESEAALRALRGISQVAVSPTASTGFRSPGCSTASKNHDGDRRVYGGGVIVCCNLRRTTWLQERRHLRRRFRRYKETKKPAMFYTQNKFLNGTQL